MGCSSYTGRYGAVLWVTDRSLSTLWKTKGAVPAATRLPCTGGGDPRSGLTPGPRSDDIALGYPTTTWPETTDAPAAPPWNSCTDATGTCGTVRAPGNERRRLHDGRRRPELRQNRVSVLGDLDPALAHGVDHGLRAIVDRQLAQDGAHVVLDRLLADRQRVGNLLVGHALGDVVQDLDLAG
jgi:hypothetical protein